MPAAAPEGNVAHAHASSRRGRGLLKRPGVHGARELRAGAHKIKAVAFKALLARRFERRFGLVNQQLVVSRLQQAFQPGEGHLQQVVAGIVKRRIGDVGRGGVGAEAVGAGPSVVGEGLGERIVFELGHFERDIVAETGRTHRLDGYRWADAGLYLEYGHFLHGAAVGIHQGARAIVELRVS